MHQINQKQVSRLGKQVPFDVKMDGLNYKMKTTTTFLLEGHFDDDNSFRKGILETVIMVYSWAQKARGLNMSPALRYWKVTCLIGDKRNASLEV